MKSIFFLILLICFSFVSTFIFKQQKLSLEYKKNIDQEFNLQSNKAHKDFKIRQRKQPERNSRKLNSIFKGKTKYISDGFDFPVGKPDAENYYNAQLFLEDNHLGEDWNGKSGGNSDLGDPVYAISNGYVSQSKNICCGWGNTVRVIHKLPKNEKYKYVESIYTHLNELNCSKGSYILKGEKIGTIGTGDDMYTAHLHFELRNTIFKSIGTGYSEDTCGYLNPSEFILNNREF